MIGGPDDFVVVRAFTNVHEAHFAKSVLEAAGIEVVIADEHVISMDWFYSNAVGGVKLLVPPDRVAEARQLLTTEATIGDHERADLTQSGAPAATDVCERCGGADFDSVLPGKHLAFLSWLTIGVPIGPVRRVRRCKRCGAPATRSDQGLLES